MQSWFSGRNAVCLLALLAVACSEPLEFADWTVPVPEGAQIVEYADVAIEDRSERIELVEDLVVGPRDDDPNYLLFRPQGVAVDDDGRMYVLEMGNNRIQVFSPEGEYIRTLGQAGQGPGEFQRAAGIASTGGLVVAHDWTNRRVSVWDTEGSHLGDSPLDGRLEIRIYGVGGGNFVGATGRRLEDRSSVLDVGLYSSEGTETLRYTSLPEPEQFMIMGDGGGMVFPQLVGGPSFVASSGGDVYATAGRQYQVLAFAPDGSLRWALRVARPAPPFGEEHKEAVLDPIRERFPDLAAMELEWPATIYTLGRLAVDGHGHLYVFAHRFRDFGPARPPVEVYSRDGDRLFAGTVGSNGMSNGGWAAARGDFVYALRANEQTDETELVRYRLIEPFD